MRIRHGFVMDIDGDWWGLRFVKMIGMHRCVDDEDKPYYEVKITLQNDDSYVLDEFTTVEEATDAIEKMMGA